MNHVTVVGNTVRECELRYSASGMAITKFAVAVNRKVKEEESTSFFNVVAFGTLGENAAESLSKGDRVVVTGRLEQRSWETPEGDKRSVVEIVADEIGPSLRWATAQVARAERTRDPVAATKAAFGGEVVNDEPF